MANLTITVDEQILRKARMRALERNESVNRYLADALARYATDAGEGVAENLISRARQLNTGHVGAGRGWSRQELHRD